MNLTGMNSTSAAGAMFLPAGRTMLAGLIIGLNPTSASALSDYPEFCPSRVNMQTTAGAAVVGEQRAGAALAELRRLTGLTWDQLARMFGVTRRSLHFWASGKAMSPSNEERLQRTLATIRKVDRGSMDENRTALFTACQNGQIPFDLLVAQKYDLVLALLGTPIRPQQKKLAPLSPEAQRARRPPPPEQLIGSLQVIEPLDRGRLLAAKAIRIPRGK